MFQIHDISQAVAVSNHQITTMFEFRNKELSQMYTELLKLFQDHTPAKRSADTGAG